MNKFLSLIVGNTTAIKAQLSKVVNEAFQKSVEKFEKTEDELLAELSKEYGEDADYLEKNRKYRAESIHSSLVLRQTRNTNLSNSSLNL